MMEAIKKKKKKYLNNNMTYSRKMHISGIRRIIILFLNTQIYILYIIYSRTLHTHTLNICVPDNTKHTHTVTFY